jgi:hypothetical protein
MSLAYGVEGELTLELENNFGDYYEWDKAEVLRNINLALKNMLTFADDTNERKEIRALAKDMKKKEQIAEEFIKDKKEEGGMK